MKEYSIAYQCKAFELPILINFKDRTKMSTDLATKNDVTHTKAFLRPIFCSAFLIFVLNM